MSNLGIKKLLKKGLLLIIPVYILWFLYIEYMPDYYNRATNTRWQFINRVLKKEYEVTNVKTVFLGESRLNAGINFKEIPNSFSFASGGSTSVEMYYILKKYIEEYPKPKKVFLSISPRFFCETYAFYPYAVRNNLFSYSDFNEITSKLQKNDTTIGEYPTFKFLLYKFDYLEYYQSDVLYNYVLGGHDENVDLIKKMLKQKGGRPHSGLKDSCSSLNYETKYAHFIPSRFLENYFDKILNLCLEKNIDLDFFFMPMNKSSYDKLNPKFVAEYKNFISKYQKKYPEFNISDSVYFYSDKFFGDESHLNLKGKQVFTKSFLKQI